MGETEKRRNKFQMDLTPKKSYDQLEAVSKKEEKPKEKKEKKKKKVFKQVSLLLSEGQYEKIANRASAEERSMTYLVKKHLENTGFFND